jgi:hypothetical protein
MWFIIRVVFCVGLVYSLTPGVEVADEAIAVPQALVQAAAPAMRNTVEGAVATCTNEPKLCLEAAQLLASTHGGAPSGAPISSAKPSASESDRSIADTLTAADRATPWHGTKETRGPTRARAASRPET